MLVSEIGHIVSNSKSLYGVEQNKAQNSRKTLSEGFGHVDDNTMISRRTNSFSKFVASIQTMFAPKSDPEVASKKYLSLIA